MFFILRAKDSEAGPFGDSSDPGVLRPWGSGSSTQQGWGLRGRTPVPTADGDCRKQSVHSQGPGHPPFLPAEGSSSGSTCRDPGGRSEGRLNLI